jgi:hypothetical protein
VFGAAPAEATMRRPLKPTASASRSIQPSKPSPLLTSSLAADRIRASVGWG